MGSSSSVTDGFGLGAGLVRFQCADIRSGALEDLLHFGNTDPSGVIGHRIDLLIPFPSFGDLNYSRLPFQGRCADVISGNGKGRGGRGGCLWRWDLTKGHKGDAEQQNVSKYCGFFSHGGSPEQKWPGDEVIFIVDAVTLRCRRNDRIKRM
jgi:hypothetical protein